MDGDSVYTFSTRKHSASHKLDIKASEIVTEQFAYLEVGQEPAHKPPHAPHYTCRVMMLKTGDWSKSL